MKRPIEPNDDSRSLFIVLQRRTTRILRSMLAVVLRRDGHGVVETGNGRGWRRRRRACSASRGTRPGIIFIVSDVRMPGIDAMQVIRSLFARGQLPPFILMTAYADERLRAAARIWAPGGLHQALRLRRAATVVRMAGGGPGGRAGGG